MSGASAAVVWSDLLNSWANPALYGYTSGLELRWNHAQTPGDVRRGVGGVEYGWGGLGLAYDRDETAVDTYLTGPSGEPPGVAEFSWRLDRWGGGLSVSRMLEAVFRLSGENSAPSIVRHADLAFGFANKHAEQELPPGFSGSLVRSSATDFGLLARVTPWPEPRGGRPSVEVTWGYAVIKEPMDRLGDPDGVTPEHRRHGIGGRVGLPLWRGDEPRFVSWMAQGADPTLALTVAADFDRLERLWLPLSGRRPRSGDYIGGELEFASTLAFRFGHLRDDLGLDDYSFGFGVSPPIGKFARVRYDYARFPSFDEAHSRHTISAWLDPIAMVLR